jgi:hypothetical protein
MGLLADFNSGVNSLAKPKGLHGEGTARGSIMTK